MERLWDYDLSIPLPDISSLKRHFSSVSKIDEWLCFKTQLRTSKFKSIIAEWCEGALRLMCEQATQERDGYRGHIQAQHPNKRIKFVAGQVQVLA